jgi:hypothetical protein
MSLNRMMLHSREELETWIATIEDAREELEELLGIELGVDLADLDVLEAKLLARYPSPEAGLALDQRGVLDAASRLVGLALILNIEGARFDLDLENERSVFYRLPIVALPDGSQECPITLVTASLDRRTGTYMREVAESTAEACAAAKPKRVANTKSKPHGSRRSRRPRPRRRSRNRSG